VSSKICACRVSGVDFSHLLPPGVFFLSLYHYHCLLFFFPYSSSHLLIPGVWVLYC